MTAEKECPPLMRMVSRSEDELTAWMSPITSRTPLEMELASVLNKLENSDIELDDELRARLRRFLEREDYVSNCQEEMNVHTDTCFYIEDITKSDLVRRNQGKLPKRKYQSLQQPIPSPGLSLGSRLAAAPRELKLCLDRFGESDGFGILNLQIHYDHLKTGFEPTKSLELKSGEFVASGQFKILKKLGQGAFSTTYSAFAEQEQQHVCLKVITNDKDFFDQSLDEIKLLRYLNAVDDVDTHRIIKYLDCFYAKEHLFIVTELLQGGNLYQYTQTLTKQPQHYVVQCILIDCLRALHYIHSLGVIHADIKPENLLVTKQNTRRIQIKLIDFGSSFFLSDTPGLYIQSRSYRAPEIMLGIPYDSKIDIWSLGCVLFEFRTCGNVLFRNFSIPYILASMVAVLGEGHHFPSRLLDQARFKDEYFLRDTNEIFDFRDDTLTQSQEEDDASARTVHSPSQLFLDDSADHIRITVDGCDKEDQHAFHFSQPRPTIQEKNHQKAYFIIRPRPISLAAYLDSFYDKTRRTDEEKEAEMHFIHLLHSLLNLDRHLRIPAKQALHHPYTTLASSSTIIKKHGI